MYSSNWFNVYKKHTNIPVEWAKGSSSSWKVAVCFPLGPQELKDLCSWGTEWEYKCYNLPAVQELRWRYSFKSIISNVTKPYRVVGASSRRPSSPVLQVCCSRKRSWNSQLTRQWDAMQNLPFTPRSFCGVEVIFWQTSRTSVLFDGVRQHVVKPHSAGRSNVKCTIYTTPIPWF